MKDLELAFLVLWPLAFNHLSCCILRNSLLNFETLILERVRVKKKLGEECLNDRLEIKAERGSAAADGLIQTWGETGRLKSDENR